MGMKKLIKWVDRLAKAELIEANKNCPMFASDHEGMAVIEEEVWEASRDVESVENWLEHLKITVFRDDDYREKREAVDYIEKRALEGACELIQVVAMCQKFRMSHKESKEPWNEEFTQEHADNLISSLTEEEWQKFVVKPPSFLNELKFKYDATQTKRDAKEERK